MLKYSCRKEAGRLKVHWCPECGSKCTVERSKTRPRISGWASAMAWNNVPENYDEFTCPHNNKSWHQNVMALREELYETVSPSLRAFIMRDIGEVLEKHKKEIDEE